MRKILNLLLTIIVLGLWGEVSAQEFLSYPGGSTVSDSLIGAGPDTTENGIDTWGTTSRPKPGNEGLWFNNVNINGTGQDSIYVIRRGTPSRSLSKTSNAWAFIQKIWLCDYAADGAAVGVSEAILVPADSLIVHSGRYEQYIVGATGAAADDTLAYRFIYSGDKGVRLGE